VPAPAGAAADAPPAPLTPTDGAARCSRAWGGSMAEDKGPCAMGPPEDPPLRACTHIGA
jgi:hypothetical protein